MQNKIGGTVAFIPIRGGSKSIPLKNIKPINGRPLVYWVLDAAINCEEIETVVVSTDDVEIKEVVKKYNSDKILLVNRSKRVSSDTASTELVMLEFAMKYDFDDIVLIQATSPLLRSEHLSNGIKKYNQAGIDSVLSVVRQKRFMWSESSQGINPTNYDPLRRPRRQEFEGFLIENGAFYITSRERLISSKCRISGNYGLIEMPEETYFEIDEPNDWAIVEGLLKKNRRETSLSDKISKIKCVLTDSDGVLTDGGMYYSENGDELKKFNTRDGMGFMLLKEKGFITGIITGERVALVRRRANKMGLDVIYLGIQDKTKALDEICQKYNLDYENIAYIGDDINDLEIMSKVGFKCTVNDGMACIKEVADYITSVNGGGGAVREMVDLILETRGKFK